MTAELYLPGDEQTVALVRASWQRNGTNRQLLRKAPGQLWERVAEGVGFGLNYPTALAEQLASNFETYGIAKLDVQIAASHYGRGPSVIRNASEEGHGDDRDYASGIFRAGQRVS